MGRVYQFPVMRFYLFFLFILFSACNSNSPKTTGRFWYCWQTQFDLDAAFQKKLAQDNIDGLYIRMFDVSWSQEIAFPKPQAQLEILQKLDTNLAGIPVVFIRNNVFENISTEKIDSFSGRLCHKVTAGWKEISPFKFFSEIQFDCDWTKSTAENYFRFLNRCAEIFREKGIDRKSVV